MYLVLCNCPADAAPSIARALVEGKFAACVNLISGVKSVYEWEGEICEDGETTLLIKTSRPKMAGLRSKILEIHPYSVPEILATAIDEEASHAPYIQWVREMTA